VREIAQNVAQSCSATAQIADEAQIQNSTHSSTKAHIRLTIPGPIANQSASSDFFLGMETGEASLPVALAPVYLNKMKRIAIRPHHLFLLQRWPHHLFLLQRFGSWALQF
jgi:hypothetical protein